MRAQTIRSRRGEEMIDKEQLRHEFEEAMLKMRALGAEGDDISKRIRQMVSIEAFMVNGRQMAIFLNIAARGGGVQQWELDGLGGLIEDKE